MSTNERFTIVTHTIKFTLPTTTPDHVAQQVRKFLEEFIEAQLNIAVVDNQLMEYCSSDEETSPNSELGAALDVKSLYIETVTE